MTATDAHALSLRGVPHRVTRRHGLVSALGVAAALHGTPRRKGVPTLLPPNHTLCLMAAGPRPAPPRRHGDMLSLEHSFLLADWLSHGAGCLRRGECHTARHSCRGCGPVWEGGQTRRAQEPTEGLAASAARAGLMTGRALGLRTQRRSPAQHPTARASFALMSITTERTCREPYTCTRSWPWAHDPLQCPRTAASAGLDEAKGEGCE